MCGGVSEDIGVALETVSRTLTDFRDREPEEQHGSTLYLSSLRALEDDARRVDF